MSTFTVQAVALDNPVAPTYNTCTTTDKFLATSGKSYLLHYKNGATPTGTLFMNEQRAAAPRASTPAAPAGATKYSDAKLATSIGTTTELVVLIEDVAAYLDAGGFVNLQHTTPTTLSLAIFGPV